MQALDNDIILVSVFATDFAWFYVSHKTILSKESSISEIAPLSVFLGLCVEVQGAPFVYLLVCTQKQNFQLKQRTMTLIKSINISMFKKLSKYEIKQYNHGR